MSKNISACISVGENTRVFPMDYSFEESVSVSDSENTNTVTSINCHDITPQASQSNSFVCSGIPLYETENKKRMTNTVSLCIALAFSDKLYIAADSKSSVCVGKSSFENRTKYSVTASLCYKKIFMIPLTESSPVIGFSVGNNIFDSKNLNEFIKSLNFSDCLNINDVAEVIKTSMNLNVNLLNINSLFVLFRYEGEVLRRIIINKDSSVYEWKREEFQPQRGKVNKFVSGAEWAKELSHYMFITIPEIDESTICEINRVYENAKTIGSCFDDSVGGSIHIGKLTPEGFTWIQNGYEL